MRQSHTRRGRRGIDPYVHTPSPNFGQLTMTQEIPDYYGMPIEDMQRTSAILFDRHEQVRQGYDELAFAAEEEMHKVRDFDQHHILDLMKGIKSEIETATERGDFHHLSSQLSKTFRNYVTNDLRRHAIGARQELEAALESIQGLGLPGSYERKARMAQQGRGFNQPIEIDEETGEIVGGITPVPVSEYVDIQNMLEDLMKNWSSYMNTEEIQDWQTMGGEAVSPSNVGNFPFLEEMREKVSQIAPDEFYNAAMGMIMANDKAMDWIETKYMLDNLDPETGDIRDLTTDDLLYYFPVSPKDKDGNPLSRDMRIRQSQDAIRGAIQERRASYEARDMEVSDEDILRELHKEHYINNEMTGYMSGLGNKYVTSQTLIHRKFVKDYIYEGRLAKQSEFDAHIRQLGASEYDFDPAVIRDSMQTIQEEVDYLKQELSTLEPNTDEYIRTKALLGTAKQRLNNREAILTDMYGSVGKEDFINNLNKNVVWKQLMNDWFGSDYAALQNFDLDKIYELHSTNKEDKLKEYFIEVLTKSDSITAQNFISSITIPGAVRATVRGAADLVRGDKDLDAIANRFINELDKAFQGGIDPSKTDWHKNMVIITFDDESGSGAISSRFEQDILQNLPGVFKTWYGSSSEEKKYQDILDQTREADVHFVSDMSMGELYFHITLKDKDEEVLHRDLVHGNQLEGVNQGTGYDLMDASRSPRLKNHPTDARNKWVTGANIATMYTPTYRVTSDNRTIGSGSLQTRISELAPHLRDSGWINEDDPIYITDYQPDGGRHTIPITIRKLPNGNYMLYEQLANDTMPRPVEKNVEYANIGELVYAIFSNYNLRQPQQ